MWIYSRVEVNEPPVFARHVIGPGTRHHRRTPSAILRQIVVTFRNTLDAPNITPTITISNVMYATK